MNIPDGILIVDKPEGWTSHDVVKKIRNLLRLKKVGHTGTLDPMATGVMILLLGKATKLAYRFENDNKRYDAEVTFGFATDSYDRTGVITEKGDPDNVSLPRLEEEIASLKGDIEQIPPMFSAVKVGGKKLYNLARAGKTIERKARTITLFNVGSDITGFPVINLDITCSKGTYIRTIAHQLGETNGCPSHLSALRRTAAGNYTIDMAHDLSTIIEAVKEADPVQFIIPVSELETVK